MDAVSVVTLLVGVLAPLVVGLLTKASWSSGVKAVFLAAVAAAVGVGQGFIEAPEVFDWKAAVTNAVVVFVTAVAVHYGFWKPVGTTDAVQASLVKD